MFGIQQYIILIIVLTSHLVVFSARAEDVPKVIVLGDSLVAGFGLAERHSLPSQLERWLDENYADTEVVNAGISGDTTAGGRARIHQAISQEPDVVVVVLGGNDVLRGFPPNVTRDNLRYIVEALAKRNIGIVLGGMQAPKNLGPEYEKQFNTIYSDLAEEYNARLIPFILEGVYEMPGNVLNDGIHPSPKGVSIMVNKLGPIVKKILTELHT